MEVEESKWITKAIDNIDRYLNRGGDLKGDEPQLLGGPAFLNTIGVAMGLPLRDPGEWSDSELRRALNGELVYFEGDARKAIDAIAEQIRYCCNGDDKNFITVLPIELYWDGKLYELPLFRVQRYKDSKKYYVDNIGRIYESVDDWYNNNKLPPCKMAYPYDLTLMLRPGYDYSRVLVRDTPSARSDTQIAKGIDIAASVVGIGSGIGLIFATGGLATPLVAAGVTTAIWGTGRSGYQLIDKVSHGENINPFSNTESRMLWLGIAANLVSFGAMGASMRLTSLALRGREISTSFQLLVNVMNGTNLVVSGIAMIDSTVFLIQHYDELSNADVLMHVVSLAFWTKGVFSYRTASTLIKNAQDQMFRIIGNELTGDDAAALITARQNFNNDAQLIREYHRASAAGISVQTFSQILIDMSSSVGRFDFDGAGNIILSGGQTYSIRFLSTLPQNVRQHYFEIITNLRTDQVELFESFRQRVNNDMNLIAGINRVAVHYNLTPREATEQVLNFWARYSQMNMPNAEISISERTLVLGRAPPLQLSQLNELSNSMVRFMGEHLVRMDDTTSRQWTSSIPVLLQLETQGMFSNCQVTRIVSTGRAVVLLNENLQISIYKLMEIYSNDPDSNDCQNLLRLVGQLTPSATSSDIPQATRLLIDRYRLRLDGQRREIVNWMTTNADRRLLPLVNSNLQSFERDRLMTFRSTVTTYKATPYMSEMMNFVADLNPRNISEMVAYGEYVVAYVEMEKRSLEGQIRNGTLTLPANQKKADFLRLRARESVFRNTSAMRQKWDTTVALVQENSMVGPASLRSGLSNDALVAEIRNARIGFGSETSAAYHVLKHPTDPPGAYVQRANEVIRSSTRWHSTLTQDGDARLIRFEGPDGSAILLERDGRVLLCTFTPRSARR